MLFFAIIVRYFMRYFGVIFAIIVSYIYLVSIIVFICLSTLSTLLSTLSTAIIVYNCVCEFQAICHYLLPYCIYNHSKHFANIFCHIIYIIFLKHFALSFCQFVYIAILYLFISHIKFNSLCFYCI